jgi:hypothetical protein
MHYLQRDGDDGEPEGADESMITDPQHWPIWLDEYTEYGTVKSIGGLIVRVLCCASVRVESPVPVHVQAAVVLTGGDLVPDGEAVGHLVAPSSGRQQMPTRTEMWSDAAEHGPEPVRMPGRGAPFHRPLALPGRMMRVLGPVVQTLRLPVFHRGHHHPVGGPVAGELVGEQHPRHLPQSREQSAEERLGGHRVSA